MRRQDVSEDAEGGLVGFFQRLFGGKETEDAFEKTVEEALEEGDLKPDEAQMMLNVLKLGRRQVRDICIPRTDIVCAEESDPPGEILALFVESGHSRIPVYRRNRDNIIGVIHAKDLLNWCATGKDQSFPIARIMRKPFFIPESKNVKELLQEFRGRKNHLAVALDEYGGTSGLVTLEDVLEEIVGDIEDEHDAPKAEDVTALENGAYSVSGRVLLDDLKDEIGVELHSEQVETIGGKICELLGRVPAPGELLTLENLRFTIEVADNRQIHRVRIERTQNP